MSNKKTTSKEGKITTLKLLEETKLRLEKLREHKRESYDDLLRKILFILNTVRDEPERAKRILEKIDEIKRRKVEEELAQKKQLEEEKKRK